MPSKQRASTERALSLLVDALALLLIQLDVTPARLSEMLRTSFVKAGATLSRKKGSGRPHIARIAAVTGLTRLEVKRIVDAKFQHDSIAVEHESRIFRVVRAWQESPRYSRFTKAKALKISGAYPSFEALCKEHSGDIPHKAVVAELKNRRLIELTKRRGKDFIALNIRVRAPDSESIDTLKYVAALVNALGKGDQVLVRQAQYVSTPSNLAASYFEKSIAERVSTLVSQLQIDPRRSRRRMGKGDGLDVYAVVSRRRPAEKK